LKNSCERFPFAVSPDELKNSLDDFAEFITSHLQSAFLVLPRGQGFIEYQDFARAFEALKQETKEFAELIPDRVERVCLGTPLAVIVLRTMLGFSPPEWAYVAGERTGTDISAEYARNLDRRIRLNPSRPLRFRDDATRRRLQALISSACELLQEGAPDDLPEGFIHRLEKADTRQGLRSLQEVSTQGVPYSMLLYERLLGRPFASHRDAVSEQVGDVLEARIEDLLRKKGIKFYKTRRGESIEGFDQAPDFIVPSQANPCVVIEAKVTEDEGTARDKVTRIQRLSSLSEEWARKGKESFEVVACIDGRGFQRRSDLRKLLLATKGKVFTLKTLDKMVEYTRLKEFRSH
jgi:Ca2+-binding EF-hand superfamily protein